jgi:C-terminal processing protease CtpA/Prc
VAPYIAYENDTWLKGQSPGYMQMVSILQQVGAVDSSGSVRFTLAKPGGEPFTLTVKPDPKEAQVSMFDALHLPPVLYHKKLGSFYWYEYLADSQALYVQYNRCANDPQLKFSDFARDLFAFADSHPVKRVVVDLRFNGGGNSRVINPLKGGLKQRNSKVFVLIGRGTFSSAQDAAIESRRDLHATLVGEATGEKPNGYGEVRQITLPNSGLKMQYSTRFFHMVKDDPPALEPDILATRSLEDALAGRDPALEAALRP